MSRPLRVLQVEDNESDAALVVRHLEQAGYAVQSRRVQEVHEMRTALGTQVWDVVIADYHLPCFDAPAALRVLLESGLDIPFVVVSGAIGDDVGVRMMKAGAHDYLNKAHLNRLAAAVEREVRELRARQERREIEKEFAARQRRDDEALRQSNARLLAVLESITDGFFTLGPDWRFTYLNAQAERLLRRARQDALGRDFWDDFPENVFRRMFEHAAQTGTAVHFDAFSDLFSGWFEVHAYPSAEGLSVYFRDITERRQAEERIRRSLLEKEVLLREVHHRVKNNLQVICSMLRLQARILQDEAILQVLKECGDRVQVMAQLHEQLHHAKDLSTIDLGEYLRTVAISLFSSYGVNSDRLHLAFDRREVRVATDTATACGMIVQELLSNALKYALPQGGGGITLGLTAHQDGTIEIVVEDDGPGFPEPAAAGAPRRSLGMRLVQLFADQISAKVERSGPPGTTYRLSFPQAGGDA
ncbi:MAG TPA: histidine kinase dimerization/phosphoacceptor domain -containing protein [Bryobacteraceae bacterium]|nr:histidine kinase dimerization/phosphoacceptor domain -containing protein [Bryobacteraceae bacterium]